MIKEKNKFAIRLKIWIEDDEGNVIFGAGRYRILEAIERLHSIQAAATELKMSYRAVWGKIKASEKRTGTPLLAKEGRGSKLTPFARKLMSRYRKVQAHIHLESDKDFHTLVAECFCKPVDDPAENNL
jgi:molybdate transport system regulatory protein